MKQHPQFQSRTGNITMDRPESFVGRRFGPGWDHTWFAFFMICLILAVSSPWAPRPSKEQPIFFGVLLLLLVLWRLWIFAGWRKLIDTGNGFILRDFFDTKEYLDRDVQSADVRNLSTEFLRVGKWEYRTGFQFAEVRSFTLTLWIQRENEIAARRMTLYIAHKVEGRDPIQNFVDRIYGILCSKARDAIENGKSLKEQGWTLDRHHLTVGDKVIQRSAVRSVSTSRKGTVQVFFADGANQSRKISIRGSNAIVLAELMQEQIDSANSREEIPTSEFDKSNPSTSSLGTLIHEVDVAGVWSYRKLACFEDGIAQIWPKSRMELRFEEIAEFTYIASHALVNGSYSGSTVTFVIRATEVAGRQKWTVWNHLSNPNCTPYDRIRDIISLALATKMLRTLEEQGFVEWTQGIWFVTDGILRKKNGFFSRSVPIIIPYESITNCVFKNDVLQVYVAPSSDVAQLEIKVNRPNVFPGHLLLERLRQSPKTHNLIDESGM
jgi:hypothetical protein